MARASIQTVVGTSVAALGSFSSLGISCLGSLVGRAPVLRSSP